MEMNSVEEVEQESGQRKVSLKKAIVICVLIVAAMMIGLFFYFKYQTYNIAYITKTYENKDVNNGSYIEFVDNVLKYSKDGAVLMNKKGEEIWNQPYQMKNPIVEMCKGTLVIGDKDGTKMFVLQKDGTKGEIHTTRPIENITVSEQGIVGAVLKDEETPRVICYDAKGNVLVEQKASLVNTGYPIDLAISNDGNMLLVSYLYVKGGSATTKLVYYNFGKAGEGKKDHQVMQTEYKNAVIPAVKFVDEDTSVAIGDDMILIYKGANTPRLSRKVKVEEEIKGVVCNEKNIALILKNSGKTGSKIRMYDMKGYETMSVDFEGEYTNIKMAKNQMMLFEGNKCIIFNKAGVRKYEGKLETNVMEMIPIMGFNKYLVIGGNELQEVQLTN